MLMNQKQLLECLEGNRRLTVRTIEAYPEKELFEFKPAEVLRPFSEMIKEILHIELAYVRGIGLDEWNYSPQYKDVATKPELLNACRETRAETLHVWKNISDERLRTVEKDPFFGAEPQSHFSRLFYALENEIHHRGQGFIYLRLLGIEPPAFYER